MIGRLIVKSGMVFLTMYIQWVFYVEIRCVYHGVQYTVYSIQYTVYSIQYTVYSTQYTVYNTQYTVYNTQYTVYNTQYTVYSTQYTIHSIQYTAIHTGMLLDIKCGTLRKVVVTDAGSSKKGRVSAQLSPGEN